MLAKSRQQTRAQLLRREVWVAAGGVPLRVCNQSATSAIEHLMLSARMSEKDKFRPK
jgi:hypothetical protein